MRLYTIDQTADLLNVNISTITYLVNTGKMPYSKINTDTGFDLRFNSIAIENLLKSNPGFIGKDMDDKKYFERLKKRLHEKYPEPLKELKIINRKFKEPRKAKGYNLVKVPNQEHGFIYYVRYIENKKLVYSRWSTNTNNLEAAENFAVENRDKILEAYHERKKKKPYIDMYSILKNYYKKDSPYLEADYGRGRVLSEETRVAYDGITNKQFIPYLKKNRIKTFSEIDTPLLVRYQDYLVTEVKSKDGKIKKEKVTPQTVNYYTRSSNKIFEHLLIRGYIKDNPFVHLTPLKIKEGDVKDVGCYDVNAIKGAFNKKWSDQLSYLLNLIIYTTNIRNNEIEKIQVKDFFKLNNVWFLDIPKSKSINGVRVVPIHDFVHRKIMAYAKKEGRAEPDDLIFKLPNCRKLGGDRYTKAYNDLAKYTGYTKERLKHENIRFYSGRHFWKTLMNAEGLGVEIEEVFMGHKTSGDVKKSYNHRDKQGKKKLLEKAKKVLAILDKCIFR